MKIQDLQSVLSKIKDDSSRAEGRLAALEEEMAQIVTEQWIQIQHLEQALHMAEFGDEHSGKHTLKLFGMLDSYLSCKGFTLSFYMSQAVQQFKRFFLAFKKLHHEWQGFIKHPVAKNELPDALANEELVFFVCWLRGCCFPHN